MPLLKRATDPAEVSVFALCFDLEVEVSAASEAMRIQYNDVGTQKISQMNRFQRSLLTETVPAVAKDSTVMVAMFLRDMRNNLDTYLQEYCDVATHWEVSGSFLVLLNFA